MPREKYLCVNYCFRNTLLTPDDKELKKHLESKFHDLDDKVKELIYKLVIALRDGDIFATREFESIFEEFSLHGWNLKTMLLIKGEPLAVFAKTME
jgi:hypothetical protein